MGEISTSLIGVSNVRFPIAVGKALGVLGLGLLFPVFPSRFRPVWAIWMTGGALNILAMAVSGWRMPVSSDAVRSAGLVPGPHFGYVDADTALQRVLGDSIPVSWAGTVVSIGDLCLAAGTAVLAWLLLASRTIRSEASASL